MEKARILIVEDERIIAQGVGETLKSLGYSISGIASSGAEAIHKATNSRPDLVLMDIVLKGEMDGIEAAEQIRAHLDIPSIFMTAYDDDTILKRAKVTEPYGYLLKPFEERGLHANIQMALYRHQMEKKLRQAEQALRQANEELEGRVEERTAELSAVNARLRQEIAERRRAEEELGLLNRVMAATAAGETLESTFAAVCHELALAFELPRVDVTLFDKEKAVAKVAAAYPAPDCPPSPDESVQVAASAAFQYLRTQKRPLAVEEAQTDPRLAPMHNLLRRRGAVSLLLLPLIVDEETVGSLGMQAMEPRIFSAEEVDLARRVADQVSAALARARLQEEHRRMEEQFYEAQKMEAVGRLAGGIAHDFNNVLTVIKLGARLMEQKLNTQDPLWSHLHSIKDAAERATGLTKQLLAFGRSELVEPQVLSLNRVLDGLDKMLRRLIGEDIELTMRLSTDLWPIESDPTRIEQVVINLAVNARDAMPDGGRLTIETANVVLDAAFADHHLGVQPGEYVMLAVSDNGAGMDDEVKRHIFEPFFTTKERGKGSGLGLATVFGVVKQNKGYVRVRSEVGQGSVFMVYLPRVAAGGRAPSHHSPAGTLTPARGSESVLLVEDNAMVRDLVQSVLTAQGYEVLVAQDGEEGLSVAQHHRGPIHLLLTDVIMPRLGGRALADRLQPRRPEMRVLFISGYTDDALVRHGVPDKGIHFLPKPFDVEILAQKVRSVLDGGA
jgi:signal transduction histidine kinase/DNA-binding response OmpR family regulator